VQTRSNVVVDSSGREVAVGSITELWHKLQAANRDRQAHEAKADAAGTDTMLFYLIDCSS
jgi:hypothetical protein